MNNESPLDKRITKEEGNYLTVVKQNGLCSIQDLGRLSSQHIGFSASGASDEYAFLFANALLARLANNKKEQSAHLPCYPSRDSRHDLNHHLIHQLNHAQLEITLGQITFKAAQPCTIAITGADCNTCINDKPVAHWQTHQINTNDIISFKAPKLGLHTYLAILGGVQSKQWLNSQSQTSTESHLGFNETSITEKGEISLSPSCYFNTTHSKNKAYQHVQPYLNPSTFYKYISETLVLRFIPQALWLSLNAEAQQCFCENTFTISPDSNRMGYRLSALPTNVIKNVSSNQYSKLSKPVVFGTIQLPSNNQPIVLMKERQTMGGYPVLGSVIQTDLFKLSQLRPGNKVKFTPTTLNFAQQQLKAHINKFTP